MRDLDPDRHQIEMSGRRVLFAMAAEAEYGPALRRVINPLMTGVGPVEAGVVAGAALATLHHRGRLPDLVVSLGSAGSRRLDHAGLYQVASIAYRDIDASPFGFERGLTPFLDHPAVAVLPHRTSGIPAASLSTGGAVVAGSAYDGIVADMVDMETWAVYRAAHRYGVPLIGLRGISDGRADVTGLHDWTAYLHIIDEKLAAAVTVLGEDIAAGRIDLGPAPRTDRLSA